MTVLQTCKQSHQGVREMSASDWQKAYELRDGKETGRWQWLNECGEQDQFYPGRWLPPQAICPPPEKQEVK